MRIQQLQESMDFIPVLEKPHPKHGTIWTWAFPDEWMQELDREKVDWKRYHDDLDYEPPTNPEYRPEFNLNLANANMSYILGEVLGFPGNSSDGFHIPIDEFIGRSTQWLKQHVGKPSPEVEPEETPPGPGPRMISGGRREGYENKVIMQMNQIAREGKRHGATHVSAH